MKQKDFDREVQRDWEFLSGLVQEPLKEWEKDGAVKGLARSTAPHTDICKCGESWPCANQHITRMDGKTLLPVWEDIPEGGVFKQQECLTCADPFDMTSRLA